jgi:hypothetical protein
LVLYRALYIIVKGVAGEGQAVDNPPCNDMIRSDS